MNKNFKISGSMNAKLYNKDGEIKSIHSKNIVLNVGFDFIADAIGSSSRPSAMNLIAIGTDFTTQTPTDTQLGAQIAESDAVYSHAANSKQFSISTNFGPGVGTGAITEAGVKNSAGVFLDRTTFAVVNKGEEDALQIDFTFTMSE